MSSPELPRPRRRRRRTSVVGVIGEVLITGGVLVLLFLGWQLWLAPEIAGHELHQQAVQQTQEWDRAAPVKPVATGATPVAARASYGVQFGLLIVPRWGADYYRPIAEGVGLKAVLNKDMLGHYVDTQLPGEPGNFAIASHRTTHGGNLRNMNELQVGDHIYVETADGWYRYSFRNLEYVQPTGVGVLDPVPQSPGAQPDESIITLTSCNPIFASTERIIAYGVFDRFFPRDPSAAASGAPDEIAATVAGGQAS